jgi:hypothetical protein
MGLEEPLIVMGNGKVKSCLPSISILKEGGGTGGGGEGLPAPFRPPPRGEGGSGGGAGRGIASPFHPPPPLPFLPLSLPLSFSWSTASGLSPNSPFGHVTRLAAQGGPGRLR